MMRKELDELLNLATVEQLAIIIRIAKQLIA